MTTTKVVYTYGIHFKNWNPSAAANLLGGVLGILGGAVVTTTAIPSINVHFKPPCGLFNQSMVTPLIWCHAALELEIV